MLYIYGLYSNNIKNIRYVGKTNNINKRLYEHLNDAKRNDKTHKQKWLRHEIKNNRNINITILEECDVLNWEEKEKFWINHFNNLTNLTEGGEGGRYIIYDISYDDAKKIVKKLNINSKSEWYRYIKNYHIKKIPIDPYIVFKNKGWINWGDFLGTNRLQDNMKTLNYISYENAKKWIKINLIVDTIEDWKKLVKCNKMQ
jgi:predicted GIY-YIG superfamily endonuclease